MGGFLIAIVIALEGGVTIRYHIDDEDKTVNESFTVNGTKGLLINESGLYRLILSKLRDKITPSLIS